MTSGIRLTPLDLWTVAQTCWGEARGEPLEGIEAVAWVIRNRCTVHPRWRGQSPRQVCIAPMQFSAWNPGDPNLPLMRTVSLDDAAFVTCLLAAVEVFGGRSASPVSLATHYYAVGTHRPVWAEDHTPVCSIGHHLFFANIA